jgi:uncharacterized protein YndB with AHSA1/START domain
MLKGAERGVLVVADISGYTGFLADSELEHAQDVLRDLIQTVVGNERPLLRLSKLEGDAAFSYALTETPDGSALLDTLEAAYFAFRRRLESIRRANSCDCNACVLIPNLNLKFVAHYGTFVREKLYGVEELTGTDVIVVHRLLKNDVVESLGLAGYVILTDALLRAAGLNPMPLGMVRHAQPYEGVGVVEASVHDLEPRWQREQELRRVRVTAKDQFDLIEAEIPASPAEVWAYVTDPARRADYVPGVERVDEVPMDGRRGIGTTNHCVHGAGVSLEEVLDWRPYEYFTLRNTMQGGTWVTTEELRESDTGTRVTIRFQRPRSAKDKAWLTEALAFMKPMYLASLERLGNILANAQEIVAAG